MDLIDASAAKNPKLMLRRTESVVEKMLTNWMSICMYSCLRVRAPGSRAPAPEISLHLPAISARTSDCGLCTHVGKGLAHRVHYTGGGIKVQSYPGNRGRVRKTLSQPPSPPWHAFESSSAASLLGDLEQLACPL